MFDARARLSIGDEIYYLYNLCIRYQNAHQMRVYARVTKVNNWTEIRTAYQVARLGTISAAAEVLGIHRATVIRHIDALEVEMGAKIFQRHARGYTATEVGQDLLRVAQATEDQFSDLVSRTKGRSAELTGELIVTSHEHVAGLILPALHRFRTQNPMISVRYLASPKLLKLEYGEAHVAVRSGPQPDQPDNVVQHFFDVKLGLYVHESYAAQHGIPASEADYGDHAFACWQTGNPRFPFAKWFAKNVPASSMAFQTAHQAIAERAVLLGMGIGFFPVHEAEKRTDLIEVAARQEDWQVQLWLVTHVDLHRSTKVQSFLKVLKDEQDSR
jgi:DNA-binding transcriptional LysR family regulator